MEGRSRREREIGLEQVGKRKKGSRGKKKNKVQGGGIGGKIKSRANGSFPWQVDGTWADLILEHSSPLPSKLFSLPQTFRSVSLSSSRRERIGTRVRPAKNCPTLRHGPTVSRVARDRHHDWSWTVPPRSAIGRTGDASVPKPQLLFGRLYDSRSRRAAD